MTPLDIVYYGIGAALAIALIIISYVWDLGDQGPLYVFTLFLWPFVILAIMFILFTKKGSIS
jgi:hypothetical protein